MKLADYLRNPTFGSTRDGFGQGLKEAGQLNPQIVGLCADLTESTRMELFKQTFPDRFIEVGVAEQNLVGLAAGLALGGKVPFAASYAVFSPGRSWDQLRVSVCYSNLNVKIIGGHTGLTVGPDGASHQALEDIAITRVLPNLTVVVPCDQEEARKATHALATHRGPAYLRLGRDKVLSVTTDHTPFQLGVAQTLRTGSDISIIACGLMVQEALLAAEMLQHEGIQARVINVHTIKPLDVVTIINAAQETGAIVTAEEHQLAGGLGSAIAETITQHIPVPIEMVGVQDRFGESGNSQELLAKYDLTKEVIIKKVKKALKRKRGSHV
jgi:transketolase